MPNILLVEDDQQLARTLCRFLISENFCVTHASGQQEALRCFEQNSFDCVLLDISLQDGNGFSVCAACKQISDTPVIFLTASTNEACTVAGFDVGADDYINKPFRPRELIARIKNALRRTQRGSHLLICQDLILDQSKGTVTKNGTELFLSALEYRLLLTFMNARGTVLTRAQLADAVWDAAGAYVEDNTLSVYVKRLREKIEDDPANPQLITTVRGLGYRVAP